MSGPTRAYRSELRDEQAAETRARVLDAAAAEFATHGYSGTTIAAVAVAASVSVETVKLQGAKHELLLAAWERRLVGGTRQMEPFLAQDDFRAVVDALSDEELLGSFVHMAADLSAREHGLWHAFVSAARFDEKVRDAMETTLAVRREEFRLAIAVFDARGLLTGERSLDERAATFGFLVSAEGYEQLVVQSGFTAERYEEWLHRAIRALVLAG